MDEMTESADLVHCEFVRDLRESLRGQVTERKEHFHCSDPLWFKYHLPDGIPDVFAPLDINLMTLDDDDLVLVDAAIKHSPTDGAYYDFAVRRKTDAEIIGERLFPCLRSGLKPMTASSGQCPAWAYGDLPAVHFDDFCRIEGGEDALSVALAEYHIAIRYHHFLHRLGTHRNCPTHHPGLPLLAKSTLDRLWQTPASVRYLLEDHLRWRTQAGPAISASATRLRLGRVYVYPHRALKVLGYPDQPTMCCVNTVQFYHSDEDPFPVVAEDPIE